MTPLWKRAAKSVRSLAHRGLTEAVSWCQRAITPRHPTFRFHLADLSSGAYNPRGGASAAGATSPEAAVAFDETFIRRLHDESGVRIRDVRRGGWWRGVAHDQDVVTASVADAILD